MTAGVGRLLAVALTFVAAAALAGAVVCFPPVLERWVLTDRRIGSLGTAALLYVVAVLSLIGGVVACLASRTLWIHARHISWTRFKYAAVAVCLSGLVGAVLAEGVARLLLTQEQVLTGDALWVHRWIATHSTTGTTAGSDSHDPIDSFDADLGWMPVCDYRSEGLNTNSRGLRGMTEHPFVKAVGERRIVVVGDSFTFGEDVGDSDVYTDLLASLIDGVRVINLGVRGYGTDQQYLYLKRDGLRYAPDLVIVGCYRDNANRNVLSFRSYAKPVFRVTAEGLYLDNVPVPPPGQHPATTQPRPPASYILALARKCLIKFIDSTPAAEKWDVTPMILDAMVLEASKAGAKFLLVYIPEEQAKQPEDAELVLGRWARVSGVPFLNLRETFMRLDVEQRRRLYADHWTPFGHRIAARAIKEMIDREGLLPEPVP